MKFMDVLYNQGLILVEIDTKAGARHRNILTIKKIDMKKAALHCAVIFIGCEKCGHENREAE